MKYWKSIDPELGDKFWWLHVVDDKGELLKSYIGHAHEWVDDRSEGFHTSFAEYTENFSDGDTYTELTEEEFLLELV